MAPPLVGRGLKRTAAKPQLKGARVHPDDKQKESRRVRRMISYAERLDSPNPRARTFWEDRAVSTSTAADYARRQ